MAFDVRDYSATECAAIAESYNREINRLKSMGLPADDYVCGLETVRARIAELAGRHVAWSA